MHGLDTEPPKDTTVCAEPNMPMHGTETNTCELANGVPNTAATIGATRTPTASKKYDPFLEV